MPARRGMSFRRLTRRGLFYFWRTNLAVSLGVAVTVGVLTGALLVGDSVRGSLRDLFLTRLGATDTVVAASHFFRDTLAEDLWRHSAPLIAFEGMVRGEASGRRRTGVHVYGVDGRFWDFHGIPDPGLAGRDTVITASLATELASTAGDTLLLRVERPSAVSRDSLHGSKDDTGRTLRLTLRASDAPEFSLYPEQDAVRAIFVPLARIQRDLGQRGRVNTVLLAQGEEVERRLAEVARLEDVGIHVRALRGGVLSVESDALMLSEPVIDAVRDIAPENISILTYLANALRVGDREIPYSLVTALDDKTYETLLGGESTLAPSLVLNQWAASDLEAHRGDTLTMEFYLWRDEGSIETETAQFVVDGIVPMEGWGADRDVAPDYPGISETEDLADWAPPFPLDLTRVRDEDEDYWDRYRTAPKAFIRLARGQRIWPVRQGKLTSIRVRADDPEAFEERLLTRLDPLELGFTVMAVKAEGLAAARGATDFGEYFVYFSYFLVVAALLLTGLFFKLGVEQRLREVGTLLAIGFPMARVKRLFIAEGTALSVLGGLLGLGVALGYAGLILYGLRTWWVDAVGTRLLSLHVGWVPLVAGGAGGVAVAAGAIAVTLRRLRRVPPRNLLAGELPRESPKATARTRRRLTGIAFGGLVLSVVLVVAAIFGLISEVTGFFGAGNVLLISLLSFQWLWLKSESRNLVCGQGAAALVRLGLRNATDRPGRSLVAIALIAFATFTIVAVDAFRKDDAGVERSRDSGSGGFSLVAESLLPVQWSPDTEEGREALNLPYPGDPEAIDWKIETFRLRDGDDASCLNLYRPQNPRVLAVSRAFAGESRFRFAATLSASPEEEENPWLLLRRSFTDGAIPVIGDASSMAYVLHLGLGEDFVLPRGGRSSLHLRLVATLRDTLFQGELLMDERNFLRHFPEVEGFRFFLVETDPSEGDAAASLLESRLSDLGLDAESTEAKLAGFHRVENTYLSTFQTLGGLGLILGTFGLAAVLLRNVLERRRELALLRAVGFESRDFSLMILAENGLLLFLGVFTGGASALVAIVPALLSRGGGFDVVSVAFLLAAVVTSGLLSSILPVAAARSAPLLSRLRAE